MYGSTIIGVVGPPYPYCSLVAFCTFSWLCLCAFGTFGALVRAKSFRKKNEKFKTALMTSFILLLSFERRKIRVIKVCIKRSGGLEFFQLSNASGLINCPL